MNSDELAQRSCQPCEKGTPAMSSQQIAEYSSATPEWKVKEGKRIQCRFDFPDFQSALALVNRVGQVAEAEGHHPNINFTWGKVDISVWTHVMDGLSENDFILAAKIDRVV